MSKYKDNLFQGASQKIFENARSLRKELTDAENALWQELRNRKLNGLKFRRQHPIGSYIADFYCSEHKLVIEVDGNVHETNVAKYNDASRTNDLQIMGIKVMRFTNKEVEQKMSEVLNKIIETLK
jgi:very-short-patch-repair endonuclease